MIRKKRNVLLTLFILMFFSFSVTSVYATIPSGTVVFDNGQALDLTYANNATHQSEVTQDVINSNGIYVNNFIGSFIKNSTNATLKPTRATLIPAVTSKDAQGNVENFSIGNGVEITAANDVITGTLATAPFGSLVTISIANPVIFVGATQFQVYVNGTCVSAVTPLNTAAILLSAQTIGSAIQVEFFNAAGTQVGTTQNATLNNTFNITVNPTALSLPGGIASTLPDATMGTPYTASIKATGGTPPYRYVATGLPTGLTMGTDGAISGTPAQITLPPWFGGSTDIFNVSVTDSATPTARTISQNFNITVYRAATGDLIISRDSHFAQPLAVVGTPYSNIYICVSGGTPPYSLALAIGSTLPAGLTLSTDGGMNGIISGTPTASGTTNFTVNASDGTKPTAKTASQTFTFSVLPALSLPSATLPDATVGTPYTASIKATGGIPSYSYALASGSALPAGLTLGADGTISGTPTASGTTNFKVNVTDSLTVGETTPRTASQTFSITVNPVNIDTSGMIEMTTALPTVGPSKVWTIYLNGLVDESSIPGNIYITNSKGIEQATACTVTTANGLSQINVNPVNNYIPDNYILWVRGILESGKGTKLKNQVYLKFTVK